RHVGCKCRARWNEAEKEMRHEAIKSPLRAEARADKRALSCLSGEAERGAPGETRLPPKYFLDAQTLVPLRHAFGARERADLELAGVPADGQMRDGYVL